MSDTQTDAANRTLLRNTLFTFFISGISSSALGSFIPFLRSAYSLSYDVSGILLSCLSIGNLVSTLVVGFLPAMLGRRRSILVTAVWMPLSFAVFAFGLSAPALLIAACSMMGVARGGISNFSNTMISTLPGEESTRGYNLLHGGYAVGAFLSPLLLVFLSAKLPVSGWRAAAGVITLLCLWQQFVYAKMPLPAEGAVQGVRSIDKAFLKNLLFWLGSAMLFFYLAVEYAICGWLVTYFQDIGVLNADHAQMMNSLLWLVIFIGRMIGAFLTGRVSRGKMLMVDGIGLLAFFLLMLFSDTAFPVIIGLIGVGLFMATIYPMAFAFGGDCIKGNDLGCSFMIFISSIGGILTPALVGFIAERAGIQAGMALVAACTVLLLLSIVLSVILAKKQPRRAL